MRFDEGGADGRGGHRQRPGGAVRPAQRRGPALVKDHMYGAPIRDIKFHAIDGLAGESSLLPFAC